MRDEEDWDAAQEGAELIVEEAYEDAERVLQRLIGEQPSNAYAHYFLGSALFEQAKYAKALRAYLAALERAPEYLGAMVGIGHTLRLMGRYNEAIRMARQVLARDKHDQDALFLLGSCHFARGDNHVAEQYLEHFLQTHPELEASTEAQGMLQVIRGQIQPAVANEDEDEN